MIVAGNVEFLQEKKRKKKQFISPLSLFPLWYSDIFNILYGVLLRKEAIPTM